MPKPKRTTTSSRTRTQPLAFAHPFTDSPPREERSPFDGFLEPALRAHIQRGVHAIPRPSRAPVIQLAEVVGAARAGAIQDSGRITFHSTGDTGRRADSPQGDVAKAMADDVNTSRPDTAPAFFLHLGDVIYGPGKQNAYRREFYEPYKPYPGKIIAIPGNHDGEIFPATDRKSLGAFLDNFCQARPGVPPIAGGIFREMISQPAVYWRLETPFLHIVGLYSNAAENPGFISGPVIGNAQKDFLVDALKFVARERANRTRRALLIAVHHPPFSSSGHSGSREMRRDIDDACRRAGVFPDAVIAAHAHSYQRYTRTLNIGNKVIETPYIVAGTGGINDQVVANATGQVHDDVRYDFSRKGFGYLLITADATRLRLKFVGVDGQTKTDVDTIAVNLATQRLGP